MKNIFILLAFLTISNLFGQGYIKDPHQQELASTGVSTGATLAIGASTGTFDIAAGKGFHIDSNTDFDNIVITPVIITARINIAITNILTDPVTYVLVDKNDAIIQLTSPPTPEQKRQNIFLGVVIHSDNVNVNAVNNLPVITGNPMSQMYDRWNAQGDFFNISGNFFRSTGVTLNIDKTLGEVFKTSINYDINKNNPHTKVIPKNDAFTFRYRISDSSEDSDTTVVDPNTYELAGTKTSVPSDKYTIQRFTLFPSGAIRAQYGQNLYASLEDAEANAALELFTIESNINENGLFRAHLIIKQGTTDLSNSQFAKFIEASNTGVAKETNIGGATFRTQLLNDASTGLSDGGLLTINVDTTKFDVAAGTGRVIDNTTDSQNPILRQIAWDAFIAEDLPNIATQLITYIAVDADDNLIKQSADFTPQEYRDLVVLGRIVHIDNINISNVTNLSVPFVDPLLTTVDLARAVGNINTSGNVFTAQGSNLSLNKNAGTQFRLGSNKHLDDKNPHSSTQSGLTGLTFIPAYRDGSGGTTIEAPTTAIDPDQYDDGSGILQAVANNKWTAPRVFHFSSNIVVVAYGQTVYNSLDEAIAGVSSDIFEIPGGVSGSINRAAVVVKKGETDLASANAKIIQGSKFGEFAAGGGGGTTSTLQDIYNNSTPNPEILTNPTNGAFTMRRGSALDSDLIYIGQNGVGTNTFSIDGNGNLVLSGTVDGIDIATDVAANTAKVSNVTTNLSEGTTTTTSVDVNSSDGTNATLVTASSIRAGVLTSAKFDEIVVNNAKVSNVTTNLSEGTSTTTTVDVNSSDGTNATLQAASTTRAGLLTKAKFDEIVVNNGKITNNNQTLANTSAATTHTVTLSDSGGSVQFVEGGNISLTTTGTGLDGIVTIASTAAATNLSYTASPTNGIVISDTGTDATLTLATGINAGLLAPAGFTNLGNQSGTNTGDETKASIDALNVDADTLDSFDSGQFLRKDSFNGGATGSIQFNDNFSISFGDAGDMTIKHSGGNNLIDMLFGNLIIRDNTTTRFTFGRATGNFTATGTGVFGGTGNNSFVGSLGIGTTTPASKFSNSSTLASDGSQSAGSNSINWRNSNSNAYIAAFENLSTGNGLLVKIGDSNASRKVIHALDSVNNTLFLVKGDGNVTVKEAVTATNFIGNWNGLNSSQFLRSDVDAVKTDGKLQFLDNKELILGTNNNMRIGFDGTNGFIKLFTTGDLLIKQDDTTIFTFGRTTGNFTATGTATATNFILSSDERLKTKIRLVDKSKRLSIEWKNFELKSELGQNRYGVIAQELELIHPEFVRTDDEGFKSVAYTDLLIAKNIELEDRIKKLEVKIQLILNKL